MLDRRVEITKTLRATPVVLRALVSGVDADRLRRRPAPGEWAIIEVVAHLADTRSGRWGGCAACWPRRTPSWRRSTRRPWLAGERRYLDLDLEGDLARLEQLRRQHLDPLDSLDGSGWERTGGHGQHGRMSVELYETHVAAEEVDHLAQIARLL
jgi:hypothetical protein